MLRWILNELALFIRHFGFFLAITATSIALLTKKFTQYSPEVNIATDSAPFNTNQKPLWFIHTSDVHISHENTGAINHFKQLLTLCKAKIKPQQIIIAGDLVNGYATHTFPPEATFNESHWQLYTKIRDESGIDSQRFFELVGNHDTWDLSSRDSPNNFAENYIIKPVTDKKTNQSTTGWVMSKMVDGIRLISFFPVNYPTGHGIHAFYPAITKQQINELENELETFHPTLPTILVSHFSYFSIFPKAKSSKGQTFKQILNNPSYRIMAYLSAHSHPYKHESIHHGQQVEITLTPLKTDDLFGIVTIDNEERLGYTPVHLNQASIAAVTYPIDDRYATRVYTETSFDIRLIAFGPEMSRFKVSGDVDGYLHKQMDLEEGVSLYSMHVNDLPSGHHFIRIEGDYNTTVNFTINARTERIPESQKQMFDPRGIAFGIGAFIPYQLAMFVGIWLNIPQLLTGRRLSSLPLEQKLVVSLFVLWGLVLPNFLFTIEGEPAYSDMYGYSTQGIRVFDFLDSTFSWVSIMTHVDPLILLLAGHNEPLGLSTLLEVAVSSILLYGGHWVAWRYLSEVTFDKTFTFSFGFHLVPYLIAFLFLTTIPKRVQLTIAHFKQK